jgi:adenosylcobinamide-GDP ribazoletransferase
MSALTDFHVALTFLPRLGRARISANEEVSRSMGMYPLVGAVIGLLLAMAALLPLSAWVLAWMLTGLNIWVTRGLHWDGWADLWDGWGSGAKGERFWAIVKDSHIGAFGVMGLVLGLGAQAALFEQAARLGAWQCLLFAPVFGRFCCLVLARLGRALSRPGLGRNALDGATPRALALGGSATALAALALPAVHVLAAVALAIPCLAVLRALARRESGMNGDFLGSVIIAGEFCALLPLAFQF